MKKFDHRRRFKGIVRDVRKALKDAGIDISLPAVHSRIKTGKDDFTMKTYAEYLQKFLALETADRQRVTNNRAKIDAVMQRKNRTERKFASKRRAVK
jgi:hypothetical protein